MLVKAFWIHEVEYASEIEVCTVNWVLQEAVIEDTIRARLGNLLVTCCYGFLLLSNVKKRMGLVWGNRCRVTSMTTVPL